jgi:hypothetical protein
MDIQQFKDPVTIQNVSAITAKYNFETRPLRYYNGEGSDVYGDCSCVIGIDKICSLWNQIKRRCDIKFITTIEKIINLFTITKVCSTFSKKINCYI